MNGKMLLAPILAVALVLSLAGAVSYLPTGPQASTQNQPSPEPSPAQYFNGTPAVPGPSAGSYNVGTPIPSPAATATPMTGLATNTSSDSLTILAVAAAVVLGIVAALVFFSERSLRKVLGDAQPE